MGAALLCIRTGQAQLDRLQFQNADLDSGHSRQHTTPGRTPSVTPLITDTRIVHRTGITRGSQDLFDPPGMSMTNTLLPPEVAVFGQFVSDTDPWIRKRRYAPLQKTEMRSDSEVHGLLTTPLPNTS
jgi:hypothetical protein